MTVSDLIAALQAGIDAGDWTADSLVIEAIVTDGPPQLRPAWYDPDAGGMLTLMWGSQRPPGAAAVCTINACQWERIP